MAWTPGCLSLLITHTTTAGSRLSRILLIACSISLNRKDVIILRFLHTFDSRTNALYITSVRLSSPYTVGISVWIMAISFRTENTLFSRATNQIP